MPDVTLNLTDDQYAEVSVAAAGAKDVAEWCLSEILQRVYDLRVVAARTTLEAAAVTAVQDFAETKEDETKTAASAFEDELSAKLGLARSVSEPASLEEAAPPAGRAPSSG